MQIGDLVWARWEISSMGIVIKVCTQRDIDEVYYRVRWFFANGVSHETVEFIDDLVTKEEKCK